MSNDELERIQADGSTKRLHFKCHFKKKDPKRDFPSISKTALPEMPGDKLENQFPRPN